MLLPATTWATVVGCVLVRVRTRQAKSQAELARAVGISQGAWSHIEHGNRAMRIDQLEIAAQALDTGSEEILREARSITDHLRAHGVRVETGRGLAPGHIRVDRAALATLAAEAFVAPVRATG